MSTTVVLVLALVLATAGSSAGALRSPASHATPIVKLATAATAAIARTAGADMAAA
ncbi:MAG: hypothetical protein R2713_04475 [Ilumatobacteraceae bacterium]